MNPQLGTLVAGNLTASRNRIALLIANGRQTFGAFVRTARWGCGEMTLRAS